MNIARNVVLTAADGAGGIVAYLAGRSGNEALAAEPVARRSTMDALVAKDERAEADGAHFMTAVPPTGIRAPSLTETLK